MAEQATAPATATPPATSGGLSASDVQKIVADTLGATLPGLMKPLVDSIGALKTNHESLAEAVKSLPTGDAVAKTVAQQLSAQQATAESAKSRANWINEHLKNVPAAYAEKLGNDPAKWAEEAKSIRTSFSGDLEKLGIKAPPVGSDAPAASNGTTPAAMPDTSKMNPLQLIELGVKRSSIPVPTNPAARQASEAAAAAQAAAQSAATK